MKWKLGTFSGIGIFVHWSFWILPAWILLSAISSGGGLAAGVNSVLFIFAVFGCVVLHELGHALSARHFRVGTRDITLYPIGGVASLERIPKNPWHELVIAVAGPLVNVAIAAGLLALLMAFGSPLTFVSPASGAFLTNLMWVNVALVVFNMLPAFPMDGGRVLRSVLALALPYVRATELAARVGQGVALLLGLGGLFGNPTLLFVAIFVFLAAQAELQMVRYREWMENQPIQNNGVFFYTQDSDPFTITTRPLRSRTLPEP